MDNDTRPITIADLKGLLAAEREHTSADLREALAAEREATNARFDELTANIAEHVIQPLTELQTDVSSLQHDVAGLQTNVTHLQTDVTSLQHELAEVRGELATKASAESLHKVMDALADIGGQYQDHHEDHQLTDNNITRLEQQMKELDSRIQRLERLSPA